MQKPKNYYLRSQEEEIIVLQPQSPSRQPEVPPPEFQPQEPLEPEPELPLFTEQHPMMSNQISLEAYRGQGADAQKRFTYCERWSMFMNYNEESAVLALPFHLKGIAKTWYDSLSQTTQWSLDLLNTAFINRFKPTQTVDISVLTITQNPDESADEYFSRFIDSSYIRDIPEPLQISILMKGLRPSLLTLVMPKNPQSMEEMRTAVPLAEQTANASARHVMEPFLGISRSECHFGRFYSL